MKNIKTDETWVMWPTSICPSFFDNPGNSAISGNHHFSFELEFKINSFVGERGTILSINPNHFVLHYYDDYLSAIHMGTDGRKRHNVHEDIYKIIKLGKVHKLKVENLYSSEFNAYIDDNKVLSTKNFNTTKDPQILFGSETISNDGLATNSCDIDLYSFKLYRDEDLISNHDFNNIINNKFVDLTNNCNFIHKI